MILGMPLAMRRNQVRRNIPGYGDLSPLVESSPSVIVDGADNHIIIRVSDYRQFRKITTLLDVSGLATEVPVRSCAASLQPTIRSETVGLTVQCCCAARFAMFKPGSSICPASIANSWPVT